MSITLDAEVGSQYGVERHLTSWSESSDEALMEAYRDFGDRAAFEELVHRYERELYAYLSRYIGNSTLAEDAFQATFLQVHAKCRHFDAGRKFRPWLYTIATNQAIDIQRRNKRHKLTSLDHRPAASEGQDMGSLMDLLASDEAAPSEELDAAEQGAWIRQAVAGLPEQLKTAVNLIYYQGLKYREAADVLNVPVGTVKSRLHSAIYKLTEAWKRAESHGDGERHA